MAYVIEDGWINGGDHATRIRVYTAEFETEADAAQFALALRRVLAERYPEWDGDLRLTDQSSGHAGTQFDGDLPCGWDVDDYERIWSFID